MGVEAVRKGECRSLVESFSRSQEASKYSARGVPCVYALAWIDSVFPNFSIDCHQLSCGAKELRLSQVFR